MHIATVTFVAAFVLSCSSKNGLSGYSIGSTKLPLCTGTEKNATDQESCLADDTLNRSAVTYVDAANGLPKCDATKKGAIYYVAKDKSLQSCDGKAWQIINAQGVAGAPGATGAKGEAGAPASIQNNYYTEVSSVATVVESSRTITRSLIKYSTAQGGTLVKTCIEDTWREAAGVLNGYKAFWRGYGDKACGDATTESINCNGGYAAVGGACVATCSSNNLSACNTIDLCTNSGMTWASGRCVGACSADNLAACNSLTKCQGAGIGNIRSGPGVWAGSQCLSSCAAGQIQTNRGCEVAAVCPATKRVIDNQCVDATFTVQGGNICGKYTTTVKFTAGPHIVNCDTEFRDAVIIEPGATFKVDGPWTMRFAKTLYAVGTTTDPITFEAATGNTARKWLSLSVGNDHGYGSLAPFTLSGTYNFGTKLDFVTIKDLATSTSGGSVSLTGYVTNLSIPVSETAVNLGTTSSPLYIESSTISANTVSAQMDHAHETAVINNTITATVDFKANSGLIWRNTITAPDTLLNSGSQGLVLFNTITGNLSCTGSTSPSLAQAYGNKVSGTVSLSSCPNQSDNSTSISDGTFAFADDGTLGVGTSTVTNRSTPISALILKATGWVTGATVNLELSTKLNGATIPINLQNGSTPPVLIGLPGIYTAKVKSVLGTTILLGNVSRTITVYAQGNAPFVLSKGATTNNPNWTWSSAVGVSGRTYRYKFNDANFMTAPTETKLLSYDAVSTLPDGTYTFYVQEKDENGNWSDATSSTIFLDKTIPKTPNPPRGPSPFTNSTSVTFNWDNPGDLISNNIEGSGVSSYNVRIGSKSGLKDIFDGNVRGLSKTISGVNRGTYFASVQAVDNAGNTSSYSPVSASVAIDTVPPPTPEQPRPSPSTPGAMLHNNGILSFSWAGVIDTFPGSGIASYNLKVFRASDKSIAFDGNIASPVSAKTQITNFTQTVPVSDGETYYAQVRAIDAADGISEYSPDSAAVTVDLSPPNTPAAPIAVNALNAPIRYSKTTTFKFNWPAATDSIGGTGVQKYNITISTTAGDEKGPFPTDSNDFSVSGLNGLSYFAAVQSVDKAANKSLFSVMSDTVLVDTKAPNPPDTLTSKNNFSGTSRKITFNWLTATDFGSVNSGIDFYKLRVGTTPITLTSNTLFENCSNDILITDENITGLSKEIALSPTQSTAYACLQSVDKAGNVSAVKGLSVDTAAPVAGGGLEAVDIKSDRITLQWKSASDGNTSQILTYHVYYSKYENLSNLSEIDSNVTMTPFSSPTKAETSTPTSLQTTVVGLSPNSPYYFNIVVEDATGNRSAYGAITADTSMIIPWNLVSPAPTTTAPAERAQAVKWVVTTGSTTSPWIFGGYVSNPTSGQQIYFSDLWQFDTQMSKWILQHDGLSNGPSARTGAVSWTDNANKILWLFGGKGLGIDPESAATSKEGYLNDLWKYDISQLLWTKVSGTDFINETDTYGAQGITAATDHPGARQGSVSWFDSRTNSLWLFGGKRLDIYKNPVKLNDLWKFDLLTSQWTWVSGSDSPNQNGTYGTKNTKDSTNVPGARSDGVSWTDSFGNHWLFGGEGFGSIGRNSGILNDLWKFDGANWTWVSGSNATSASGVYGKKGTAAAENRPGARTGSVSWIDPSDNLLWLFGGKGFDSSALGNLNDLWKFDGANWTWISGSATINASSVYKAIGNSLNQPGSRHQALSWIDATGILWLFGGEGSIDENSNTGFLNDLWNGKP